MPVLRWFLLFMFLLSSGFFVEPSYAQAAQQKATIRGASHATLRGGPGLKEPTRGILTEGEHVIIEGQDNDWYLVQTSGGRKGYVHKSLVKLDPEEKPLEPTVESNPAKADSGKSPEGDQAPSTSSAAPPSESSIGIPAPAAINQEKSMTKKAPTKNAEQPENPRGPLGKSPSLIELLQGREADMVLWLAIAAAFFLIGWVCGGNFYLRRDRMKRTKLRF
jgi:hypothetical protein